MSDQVNSEQPAVSGAASPSESAGASGATEAAGGSGEDRLAQVQAELNEARDRALRSQAELDNFRKRARREQEEERRFAQLPLVADLLPVADNLDRAIEAAEKALATGQADTAALLEGMRMVTQQFHEILGRHNVTRIEALHQPFDPGFHAAILQQPSADHPPNTVLSVVQHGYQLHDRVVRPSQVIVSKAPDTEA